MKDVRVIELAERQYNRFSRSQLAALGVADQHLEHRLRTGRWVAVHQGVYAIAPALGDDRARWMAATLTDDGGFLSHASAGGAHGFWRAPTDFSVVTRHGSGGPRRQDGLLVHRSLSLESDTTTLAGIPITTAERTVLDLAAHVRGPALARLVREALRLRCTTVTALADTVLTRHRGRRGSRRLLLALDRYSDLPVARCRSASEVRALEVLRDAGRPAPEVNRRIGGEEADLHWREHRLIVEIDGGPFHLDAGEDARKDAAWGAAGWEVRRISTDDVWHAADRLLALVPDGERP